MMSVAAGVGVAVDLEEEVSRKSPPTSKISPAITTMVMMRSRR